MNTGSENIDDLLNKELPSYRQAYSDRTAWIMSCLSELVYIKFNEFFADSEHKEYFIEKISKLTDESKANSLMKLIDMVSYDHESETKKLHSELKKLNLKLDSGDLIDNKGTQAIIVRNDKFVVLAFRGTEPDSIRDLKSDAKGNLISCNTAGRIHSGFSEAFDCVSDEVQEKLQKYQNLPLFITGHSLGGALAIVAAKKISHPAGIAACYTYGSPRVGNETWNMDIKTPIYRVVNAADCVTMVPPTGIPVQCLAWIARYIPMIGEKMREMLLSHFDGYLHPGDMRYLTNCNDSYESVKLLTYVSVLYRLKALIMNQMSWKALLADHSISVYRKKLFIIAVRRNQ